MVTYNHERYITQAVESVLAQRTSFEFELVIGEDCSTDGTLDRLNACAERYPGRIKLVQQQQNVGPHDNFTQTLQNCSGTYLAYLDGDDYWIHPEKLQRQVDFLDANPDLSMCVTPVNSFTDDGRYFSITRPKDPGLSRLGMDHVIGGDVHVALGGAMLRKSMLGDMSRLTRIEKIGDYPLFVLTMANGDAGYMDCAMACYRLHGGGTFTGSYYLDSLVDLVRLNRELRTLVGSGHESAFAARIARDSFDIARIYCDAGDHAAARQWLSTCFSCGFQANRGQHLLLLKLLLRNSAPKAFAIAKAAAGRKKQQQVVPEP